LVKKEEREEKGEKKIRAKFVFYFISREDNEGKITSCFLGNLKFGFFRWISILKFLNSK
jgi:hypothetical protein